MIVIDASAIVAYLLREPLHETIEQYLLNDDVHSVDFVLVECASAILKALRRNRLTEEKAKTLIEILKDIEPIITYHSSSALIVRAFHGAHTHGGSLYDWLYLSLAEELDAVFLSTDQKINRYARRIGVTSMMNDFDLKEK